MTSREYGKAEINSCPPYTTAYDNTTLSALNDKIKREIDLQLTQAKPSNLSVDFNVDSQDPLK